MNASDMRPPAAPAASDIAGAQAIDDLTDVIKGANVPEEAHRYILARGITSVAHLACSAANEEKFN